MTGRTRTQKAAARCSLAGPESGAGKAISLAVAEVEVHTGIARWTCAACDELTGRCGTRYEQATDRKKSIFLESIPDFQPTRRQLGRGGAHPADKSRHEVRLKLGTSSSMPHESDACVYIPGYRCARKFERGSERATLRRDVCWAAAACSRPHATPLHAQAIGQPPCAPIDGRRSLRPFVRGPRRQ